MIFQTLDTNRDFEVLAREFLAENPSIRHEWRQIRSIWDGGRTELSCAPGEDNEVLAVLRSYQITIASTSGDQDFEDWGRNLSAEQVAKEAFVHFLGELKRNSILPAGVAHHA